MKNVFVFLAMLFFILLIIFGGPWVVMHAWYLIAVKMFGLAAMPYWTAFWATMAINILFNASNAAVRGKNND